MRWLAVRSAVPSRSAGRWTGRAGPDGSVTVTDTTGPVLSGDLAGVVVVPVDVDGDEHWYAVGGEAFTATALGPFDPTRSVATLRFDGAVLGRGTRVEGLDRDAVEAVALTLAAAECSGIASWCVETAAAHACDRRQFGRPIGQFQAVKHRCADMLVAAESARARRGTRRGRSTRSRWTAQPTPTTWLPARSGKRTWRPRPPVPWRWTRP